MLTGNNGILTQAKLAKENTEAAKEQEGKDLDKINSYINEKTIKDNYTDINGDKATIPEGFSVDKTENVISKGLIVHGPDKANGDNGSEFVWVPVPDINSMAQCSTAGGSCNLQLENDVLKCKTHNDNEEIVGKLYSKNLYKHDIDSSPNIVYNPDKGIREPAVTTESNNVDVDSDSKADNNDLFSLESLKIDYKNMAASVAKYSGFYVGRYETSLSNATKNEAKDGNAQSKSGVIPTSANNEATLMWYGLYKIQNKTYTGTNNSVESSMIWGSQYDRIINWVKEGEEKEKTVDKTFGNKNGSVTITGDNNYIIDSLNNIMDLGGNLYEWTLEAYNSNSRIFRGGDYNIRNSPSYRCECDPNIKDNYRGSRMTLYIK
ncbi:MAG: hypothetical protein V8R81_06030 [Clostridia bacterium]